MNYPHGVLTPEQIRTTFFDVPRLGIEFLYGRDGLKSFVERRNSIRDMGGDLLLIGWPDGTTLEYTRPKPKQDIDAEDLAAFYHLFHIARGEREAQGEQL